MPDHRARPPHQAVGDPADVQEGRGQKEERHCEQDERVVGVERFLHQRHRRQVLLDDEHREASEPERERDRDPERDQTEEYPEEDQRGRAGGERGGADHATAPRPASTRKSSSIRSPWKTSQVAPASGQATWISHSGSSASSEIRFQANLVNSMPNHRNTIASARIAIPLTILSAAAPRAPSCGQTSTSK